MDKSKNDLSVTCSMAGCQTSTVAISPKFVGTTFGNILLGGGVGAVVDAATGANYEYPNQVTLQLAPMAPAPAVAVTSGATPAFVAVAPAALAPAPVAVAAPAEISKPMPATGEQPPSSPTVAPTAVGPSGGQPSQYERDEQQYEAAMRQYQAAQQLYQQQLKAAQPR